MTTERAFMGAVKDAVGLPRPMMQPEPVYDVTTVTACPSCDHPYDRGRRRRLIDKCGHERCFQCVCAQTECPMCSVEAVLAECNDSAPMLRRGVSYHGVPNARLPQQPTLGASSFRQVPTRPPVPYFRPPEPPVLCSATPNAVYATGCSDYWRGSPYYTLDLHKQREQRNGVSPLQQHQRTVLAPNLSPASPDVSPVCVSRRRPFVGTATDDCYSNVLNLSVDDSWEIERPPSVDVAHRNLVSQLSTLLQHTDQTHQTTPRNQSRIAVVTSPPVAMVNHQQDTVTLENPSDNKHCLLSPLSSSGAPSPVGSTSMMPARGCQEISLSKGGLPNSANESLMSLISTSSTSGIAHSCNSPLTSARMRHPFRGLSSQSSRASSIDDGGMLGQQRRQSARCSARLPLKERTDSGAVISPAHSCTLNLDVQPLVFEVPWVDCEPFSGREWVFHELHEILLKAPLDDKLCSSVRGAVIHGGIGTGKTALMYQLAQRSPLKDCLTPSCPGATANDLRRRTNNGSNCASLDDHTISMDSGIVSGSRASLQHGQEWCRAVASQVVAYHFCQVDSNRTCTLSEFLSSLAAMLAEAKPFRAYADHLSKHRELQDALSEQSCLQDPAAAFRKAIVEPLISLRRCNRIPAQNYLILIDAVDESEYHRPEYGDSVGSFACKYFAEFPTWIKVVFTVKTVALDVVRGFPCHKINLDNMVMDERLYRDVHELVAASVHHNATILSNVCPPQKPGVPCSMDTLRAHATRFAEHLTSVCKGNLLYVKLTLNLIERNCLVMKGTGYNCLPINLSEVFLLLFNLKFPYAHSFERIAPILNVCLASLYPLTAKEIFETVNAGLVQEPLTWEQFCERLLTLTDFFVQRQDDTFVFFHPAFREWLIRRDPGEQPKFLCDVKHGHCLLALRLSRRSTRLNATELLELGHHLLKAHTYKLMARESQGVNSRDAQAFWVAQSALDLKNALVSHRNIFCPNTKVSRLLLLAGASADARTDVHANAPLLCVAARSGCVGMVCLLLEFGADVAACGDDGMSALMHAASLGHLDVVQILHQHGAKLSQIDQRNWSPLVHAAAAGHVTVCSFLLQCDWSELTSSMIADTRDLMQGSSDASSSCSTMHSSAYGHALKGQAAQQAFVMAASAGQTAACRFLLEFGEVVLDDCDPITEETALSLAALNAHKDTVHYLLTSGARTSFEMAPSHSSSRPRPTPPLIQAVLCGSWEIVSCLLTRGLSVDRECNRQEQTPLMVAAMQGHIGVLELLLSRDASVHCTDVDRRTALSLACMKDQAPCAALLLDRGAVPDHVDSLGNTPLHLAAEYGSRQLVSLLMDRCGHLEQTNYAGLRPLDLAIQAVNLEAVACFLKKGAKLGPTTWVLATGKTRVLVLLLNKLLDDGVVLYKKNRLKESAQRFQYALKKFPADLPDDKERSALVDIKFELLINFARCKRKQGDCHGAVALCDRALDGKPASFEAFYVRARCHRDLGEIEHAHADITEAVRVCPANRDGQQMLFRIRDELNARRLSARSRPDSALSVTSGHRSELLLPICSDDATSSCLTVLEVTQPIDSTTCKELGTECNGCSHSSEDSGHPVEFLDDCLIPSSKGLRSSGARYCREADANKLLMPSVIVNNYEDTVL